MVRLVEWVCLQAMNPYLDMARELTVGTRVNLSHSAPTAHGLTVAVNVPLAEVDGRRIVFDVSGVDTICEGTRERFVIDVERINANVARKSG